MKRVSNAQSIYKSKKSTSQLLNDLNKGLKIARQRLRTLKKSGLSSSEFYQNNKDNFKEIKVGKNRLNISKELAKVNQFLNAKSSTPKGLLRAEKQFIEVFNERYGDNILNEKNVRIFQGFMKMYKEKYQDQVNLPSDIIVNAFIQSERLKISPKDILDNLETFAKYEEEISNMNLEDMFDNGVIDKRRRFKLSDYLSK